MRKRRIFIIILSLAAVLCGLVWVRVTEGCGLAFTIQGLGKRPGLRKQFNARQEGRPASPEIPQGEPDQDQSQLQQSPRPRQPNRMQVLRSLGLTQEQWQMARRLHQKLGPQMQQLHDELEERQDAFNQAMFSDPYNPKLIEERLQAVLEKQQQVMRAQMEMERGFREILTPAQLERFRELQNRQLEIRRLERQIREQQRHLMQDLQPATR